MIGAIMIETLTMPPLARAMREVDHRVRLKGGECVVLSSIGERMLVEGRGDVLGQCREGERVLFVDANGAGSRFRIDRVWRVLNVSGIPIRLECTFYPRELRN